MRQRSLGELERLEKFRSPAAIINEQSNQADRLLMSTTHVPEMFAYGTTRHQFTGILQLSIGSYMVLEDINS